MGLKILQLHDLERASVSCFQYDFRSAAMLKRLLPARGAQAPSITWLQSGKAPLGMWRTEIISDRL